MTAKKPAGRPPIPIDEEVAAWLVENDKELWARKILLKSAVREVSISLNRKVSMARVKQAAVRCRFWRSADWKCSRSPTRINKLTSEQWDRVAAVINKNASLLMDASELFAIRILRLAGAPANEHILKNSMAWKNLQKRKETA